MPCKRDTYAEPLTAETIQEVTSTFIEGPFEVQYIVRQGRKVISEDTNPGFARKAFIASNGQIFVLKNIPQYASSRPEAEARLALQCELRNKSLPIPEFLPQLGSPSSFIYHRHSTPGQLYTMQKVVKGVTAEHLSAASENVIDLLLRIHSVLKRSSIKLQRSSPFAVLKGLLRISFDELVDRGRIRSKTDADAAAKLLIAWRRHLSIYEREARDAGYYDRFQLIHGDCHLQNFLFNTSHQVIACLDFDDAKIDNPLNDFGRFITSTAIFDFYSHPNSFPEIPTTINGQLLESQLAICYEAERHTRDAALAFACVIKCCSLQVALLGFLSGAFLLVRIEEIILFQRRLECALNDHL